MLKPGPCARLTILTDRDFGDSRMLFYPENYPEKARTGIISKSLSKMFVSGAGIFGIYRRFAIFKGVNQDSIRSGRQVFILSLTTDSATNGSAL